MAFSFYYVLTFNYFPVNFNTFPCFASIKIITIENKTEIQLKIVKNKQNQKYPTLYSSAS